MALLPGALLTYFLGSRTHAHEPLQVLKWIFEGGAGSFEDMANIPKALRAKLAEVATVGVLEVRKHYLDNPLL